MEMKTTLALSAALAAGSLLALEPFPAADTAPDRFDAAADAKMKQWNAYISNYKPDYSDSSKYLMPPEDHRFAVPFAVVKDGKPMAEIVLAEWKSDMPVLRTSAEELQKYIHMITGVKIPISDGWGAAKKNTGLNKILLGKRQTPDTGKFSALLEKLSGGDGYAIVREGTNLYVFGALDKGTMNGVYALLENNTDLIWTRPDESIGTVFTPKKDLDFLWGEDVTDIPDTRGRGWNGYADTEWMAHNRCNIYNCGGGGDISWMNAKKSAYGVLFTRHLGGHNIFHFLRGLTDPTLFAHNDAGERTGGQPCFTNPEMKKHFIASVLNFARRAPENTDKLYINLQDTWKACVCSRCMAPLKLADGTELPNTDAAFRSTQYFLFLNDVVKALNREFPNMKIVTLAYFSTAPAPRCEVDPHITPEYAPYVRSNDKRPLFAPENRLWLKRLYDWSKISPEIEIYDYYGLGLSFPRPLAEVRAWDFTEMHPYVVGMSSEYKQNGDTVKHAADVWDCSAMELWVLTRLTWNPSQDVEQLRKYFLRRAFHEGAPAMEKYYGTIRAEWFKSDRASTLGDDAVELTKLFILDTKREEELRGYLSDAEALAQNEKSKELVKRVRARFEAQTAAAKNIKTPAVAIPLLRPSEPVTFDSGIWNGAAKIPGLQKMAKGTPPSSHSSEISLFHDSDNLHIRFAFKDANIADLPVQKAPDGKKEFIPDADHVEIFLCDPLDDSVYYLFTVSPDNLSAELKAYDSSWNGEWTRSARRTADGWEALVSIPLKTIHADNEKGNLLRGTFIREYHPHGGMKREYGSWSGGGHHKTATFGTIKLMR